MTFDERVEKAADALFDCEDNSRLHAAQEAIRAAFPELYGEKPTHEIKAIGQEITWDDLEAQERRTYGCVRPIFAQARAAFLPD